jgi:DNA/RNA endonuclease YhcR with UshA esterase domain
MNDMTLLRAALLTGIIGIIALFVLSSRPLEETAVEMISCRDTGDTVKISGRIEGARQLGGVTIMDVSSSRSIPVVVFDNYSPVVGAQVTLTGKVEVYKGQLEVLASTIE